MRKSAIVLVSMVEQITSTEANAVLRDGHYLGSIEYPATIILAERGLDGSVDAVAVYGPPVAQHFKVKLRGCLELTRLWQSERRRADRSTRGPLSHFVRDSLAWLREHRPEVPCVFSYTDPGINGPSGLPHHGAVYQASRFKCFGMSRITDYWWTPSGERISAAKIYRREKTKSRRLLTERGYRLEEKPPKILFVFGLQKSWREVRDIIGGRYADVK
jgi:hypothetical protein